MTDKELDKLFQQSFSAHEMPVSEDMWQRVKPQEEKKRKVVFWWWTGFAAAALLVAGVFAWWNGTPSSGKSAVANIVASSKNKSTQPAVIAGSEEKKSSSSAAVINQKNKEILPIEPAKNLIGFQQNQVVIVGSEMKANHTSNRAISKEYFQNNTGKLRPVKSEQKSEELLPLQSKTANDFINDNSNETKQEAASSDALKPTDSAASIENSKLVKLDSANFENKPSTVKIHLPKPHKTAIELMVAGYVGDRNVYHVEKQPSAFSVSPENPQQKTVVNSYSLNMRVEKQVSRHWSLKTGLQFLQTRQSVTYNAESVSRYAVVNALSLSADTTRFTEISVKRPQIKSIYNSFNIPFFISFHTAVKKIDVGVSGGILVNVFSWYKGEVPDGNYRNTINASKAFRWNSGSSLYLSLPVAKSFGKWQVFAEPQLQYSLSSLTKKSASFQQRITYYGVGVGIKKSIGK